MGRAPESPWNVGPYALVSGPPMSRRSLRPQLNQIRGWVRQGRTDAWIAHQLEVTVQQIQAFKREQGLEPDADENGAGARGGRSARGRRRADRRRARGRSRSQGRGGAPAPPKRPRARRPRRRPQRGRRRPRPRKTRSPSAPPGAAAAAHAAAPRPQGPLEGTFDHGEEGYGLWLDPAVQDDPIYAEHWAGHRPVEITIEEDQIVIRRSGGGEDDDERLSTAPPRSPGGTRRTRWSCERARAVGARHACCARRRRPTTGTRTPSASRATRGLERRGARWRRPTSCWPDCRHRKLDVEDEATGAAARARSSRPRAGLAERHAMMRREGPAVARPPTSRRCRWRPRARCASSGITELRRRPRGSDALRDARRSRSSRGAGCARSSCPATRLRAGSRCGDGRGRDRRALRDAGRARRRARRAAGRGRAGRRRARRGLGRRRRRGPRARALRAARLRDRLAAAQLRAAPR